VIAVCALCFATLAPFLRMIEFSNGGENAVVASVQEIRRGGPWLVPTLQEEIRTKKPPLATWISALAARPATVAKLSSTDPAERDAAFRDFAWQVRWPALVAMCGMVITTGVLAHLVGGARLAAVSAAVCGGSLFWLQSARITTTDAHLALWVGVANCLFALGALRGKWNPALIGGGAALGLAMMSKGPVALLQTIVPLLAFVAWRWWRTPRTERTSARHFLIPLAIGLVLFAAIGLSWYLLVMLKNPAGWEEWKKEISRQGATGLDPSPWYNYFVLPGAMFPWTFFFIAGIVGAVTNAVRRSGSRENGRIVLVLFMLVGPILVMSFFPDRKLRYLIPLLPAASILAGWAVLELLASPATRPRHATLLVATLHWLPLAVAAVGLPIAAQFGYLRDFDGNPWYSLRFSIVAVEAFAALIVVVMLAQRRRRVGSVVAGTFVVMLAWNVVFDLGYRTGREGRSEMRPLAELILAKYPNAKVYSYRADRPTRQAPIDLSIYLNRATTNLRDLSELKDKRGERVYVVRQRNAKPDADPTPLAPPVGGPWEFIAAAPIDNATWYAFVAH
jgi:4-amino-4-deoxy-L-arabinose transferase-like glycosyltransferase